MSICVLKPGPLTTIQASPRSGVRHYGVAAGGSADPLSMALANRLVGNEVTAALLEATLVGPTLEFSCAAAFAITGATVAPKLNGASCEMHRSVYASQGDVLEVGAASAGARIYVAVAGGLRAETVLGSASTCVTAGFGGYRGRALVKDDRVELVNATAKPTELATPDSCRLPMPSSWALRATHSAETGLLDAKSAEALFDSGWTVASRADRMGIKLDGSSLVVDSDGRMPSAAVFPGTIQCTEGGVPFMLGVDAGTTGGYPRVAHIARADRHLLGQLRPGDGVGLLFREPGDARTELIAKHEHFRPWLAGIEEII